jgi:hypothetical protein
VNARQDGLRHALLRTLPGRAIVIGLAVKIVVYAQHAIPGELPVFNSLVDTLASKLQAAGGGVFKIPGVALAQRRLLWRVRRKLFISTSSSGSSRRCCWWRSRCSARCCCSRTSLMLVQARLRTLADRADSIAKTTALEIQRAGSRDMEGIVAQREMAATREFEGASIAVVEMRRACGELPPPRPPQTADSQPSTRDQRTPVAPPLVTAGPWAHVEVPAAVGGRDGFRGLLAVSLPQTATTTAARTTTTPRISVNGQVVSLDDQSGTTYMLIRALAFPDVRTPKYAVIVDLPVSGQVRRQFRAETGVERRRSRRRTERQASPGAVRLSPQVVPARQRAAAASFIMIEHRDWLPG